MEFIRKLQGIMKERFPDAAFGEAVINYDQDPNADIGEKMPMVSLETPPGIANTLFIGIGTGALVAAKIQEEMSNRLWTSLFAVNPPPGIMYMPTRFPRIIIHGSTDGPYYRPLKVPIEPPYISQVYGFPSFTHGPKLAMYAIAFLLGHYMHHEDLYEQARTVSGTPDFNLLPESA